MDNEIVPTEPAEAQATALAVIEAAEKLLGVQPTAEDLISHAEEVFTYGDRKLRASLDSTRKSERPLCAGCAFGIRKETAPKLLDGRPYHPNCLKAALDPAFALKTSPKYLAAAVPLMSPRALEAYRVMDLTEDEDTEDDSLEDATADLVQEAVAKGKRKKAS